MSTTMNGSMELSPLLRFNLPPPNENVDHLCYLVFGSGEYDDEMTQYYRELSQWWKGDKEGPKPTHWRQRVRDRWAGIRIWEDPESPIGVENGYQRAKLYDPMRLQEMLWESPRVIRAVHATIEDDGSTTAMRRVQRELLSFFRNEFKADCVTAWWGAEVSSGNSADVDVRWQRAFKFLEASVDLIAQCLLLNYELYPLEWSTRVMQHGEPSEQWLRHVEQVTAADTTVERPRHIQRVMAAPVAAAGPLELEPEPIRGLIYDDD